ncbi:MAG: HAD family hydrolase [Candidatus Nanohalobium sp.]
MTHGFDWADNARKEKARELGYNNDLFELRALFEAEKSAEAMKHFLERHEIDVEDLKTWEKHAEQTKIDLVKKGDLGLYPDARKLLENLDVPKALVSNAYGEATDRIVRHMGLDTEFEFWKAPSLNDIETYVENMKPNPDMLQEAMNAMNSENAVMVGDSKTDVGAAENAGIDSIYINRSGETFEKTTFNAESLEEVRKIVRDKA